MLVRKHSAHAALLTAWGETLTIHEIAEITGENEQKIIEAWENLQGDDATRALYLVGIEIAD